MGQVFSDLTFGFTRSMESKVQTRFSSQFRLIFDFSRISLLNLLIWTLGFLVMCGLTLKEILPLIDEYQNHNEAINVTIVLIDDSFKAPQMAIVLPHYQYTTDLSQGGSTINDPVSFPREPEQLMTIARHLHNGSEDQCVPCKKLREVGWDVWKNEDLRSKYSNETLQTYYNALWISFMEKILTVSYDVFQQEYSTWNEVAFSAAINFHTWIARIDYSHGPVDLGTLELRRRFDALIYNNSDKLNQLSTHVLQASCQEITFAEFESSTEFQQRTKTNNTCPDLFKGTTENILLDEQGLWIPLPTYTVRLIKTYQFTIIRRNSSKSIFFPPPDSPHGPFWVYPDQAVLYLSSTDDIFASHIAQTPTDKAKFGHKLTIKYSIQMRTKESRQKKHHCYGGNGATGCFTKCTKQAITEDCMCIPFTYKRGYGLATDFPFCHSKAYEVCNATYADLRCDHCLRICQSSCEFASYNWQVEYETFEPKDPDSMELILKTVPIINSFTEFSWMEKNTREQFISQMAGIANLYLKFDGLILVAGLLWLIEVIKKLTVSQRKSTTFDQVQFTGQAVSLEKTMAKEVMSAKQYENFQENMQKWMRTLKAELREELNMSR